ncbi:glycosyltransferase family 4 protein [Acinetobacter pittii]|uniref:glycosyltransferase family 4 protein n=1 Tax=Acinetobacter pittii TaxID=48296 RepID=UPI001902145B|nr:glycosyltransferase family 4 protein [Acinetobacter pittii]MBJ9937546.1 glycosyltransferase family 4 protein [Acinetobacter pittii]
MKILFVINSLKSRSGTERVAIDLANYLAKSPDNKIVIANRDTDKSNTAYPVDEEVDIIACEGNYLSFFLKLKKNIELNSYDILIVHNMGRLTLLCLWLSNIIKIVSLEHSSFISRSQIVRFFSKIFYNKVDKVVTLTSHECLNFSKIHKNVLQIPNFSSYFDSARIVNMPKKNIAISVGRLDENKNNIHILKAWHRQIDSLKNWELHIYGEGDQKDNLVNFVKENNLTNVFFKGVTQEPNRVYEEASFFIMSSKFEGLPMVLVEAQCFGLPIISYNCPYGPSDVIQDRINGFLVENQNIDALGEAILQLTSSENLLRIFSEKALLSAKKYQPEKIIEIWNSKVIKG